MNDFKKLTAYTDETPVAASTATQMNNDETNPLREEPKCSLSDSELIAKSLEWVSKLAKTGGKAWTLRVPVDFNHDPDILFSELCNRLQSQSLPAVPKLSDKIGHINCTPEALKDPEFVAAINQMAELAYHKGSKSLPAVEQPEDRNMQDGYYLDCYNNGCQLNCPKCPDKCKVEQPEKDTVIEQTKKEFTREGISFAVNEDQEAVKKASAQFGSTANPLWLSGRQQGFHAGMEHASKFTDALIQEITSLRYKLSQQPSQPEGKTLEECKDEVAIKYGYVNWSDLMRDNYMHGVNVESHMSAVIELYANQPRKESDIINLAKSCLFLGRRGYLNITSDEDCWKDFMSHPDNVELLNKALGSQK